VALNLIRKNNGVGITAYQDAVLFHLAKGENGVIPDVHDEFEASYDGTSKILRVESGMGIAYGRQFEIVPGEEIQFDFSALAGTRYIVIYVEIDLRDPTNEVASLKSSYASTAYPVIDAGDDLINVPSGIHRMVLYHVLKTGDNATIETKFNKLQNDKIKYASFAEEATNAVNAHNSSKVGNNTLTNSSGVLKATMDGESKSDIIERKRLIWNGNQTLYNTSSVGTTLSLSESLSVGEIVEIIYACKSTDTKVERVRVLSSPPGLGGSDAGFNLTSIAAGSSTGQGFTATSDTFTVSGTTLTYRGGYYLLNFANEGGTLLSNNSIVLYRIYKIVGGETV
jgi:hypothetical protein